MSAQTKKEEREKMSGSQGGNYGSQVRWQSGNSSFFYVALYLLG